MIPAALTAAVVAGFIWLPQPPPPPRPVEIVCVDVGLPYLLCHTVIR